MRKKYSSIILCLALILSSTLKADYGDIKSFVSFSLQDLDQQKLHDFLIENLFSGGLITNPATHCMDLKTLTVESANALSLYKIQLAPSCVSPETAKIWYLKEVGKDNLKEVQNLWQLTANKNAFSFLPNDVKIILPIQFYTYNSEEKLFKRISNIDIIDTNKDEHIFYLIEGAKGVQLSLLLTKNRSNLAAQALKDFAKALAYIHQYFMDLKSLLKERSELNSEDAVKKLYLTVLHGDAHWGNVFYDQTNETISFIDNENFFDSMRMKKPLIFEFVKLLFYSSSNFGQCSSQNLDLASCKTSIDMGKYLLQSYISFYPSEYQENLKIYLKTYLTRIINYYSSQYDAPEATNYWKESINSL